MIFSWVIDWICRILDRRLETIEMRARRRLQGMS